jgi:hypothetical protein
LIVDCVGLLGVQVDYNVVHLRTSLVQLFVLLQNFEKVVQMIELKRFGGAPNGYPFAPLWFMIEGLGLRLVDTHASDIQSPARI